MEAGRPPALPFSNRLPIRSIAESVGVLTLVTVGTPNNPAHQACLCPPTPGVKSATSTHTGGKVAGLGPIGGGSCPSVSKPTRYVLSRRSNASDDVVLAACARSR